MKLIPIDVSVLGHVFSIDPVGIGSIKQHRGHYYITAALSSGFFFTFEGSLEETKEYRAQVMSYIKENH